MNRYADSWSAAARRLGVELRGPVRIKLADGREIDAPMHIPQFGAEKGMLIFSNIKDLPDRQALTNSGYGYSVFAEPSGDCASSEDDLIEILSDWGWSGADDEKPHWLSQ